MRALACLLALAIASPVFAESGPAERVDRLQSKGVQSLCSNRNAKGVGLAGEYFAEPGFAGERVERRIDAGLDFASKAHWPSGGSGSPRSMRWSGWIRVPVSGSWRFHVGGTASRVTVARHVVVDAGRSQVNGTALEAGRYYPINVEVAEVPDEAIRLEWTAPYGARYVVPRQLLFLPTETWSASKP